jgi:hypothetical protein
MEYKPMQSTLIWDREVYHKHVRFEICEAVSIKSTMSWDVMPCTCSLVDIY